MEAVSYKDTKLYFRGNRLTRSNFLYLINNYNLLGAQKIILSGGSAGAVANIVWANYLHSVLPNPNILYNVPDCGIFLNVKTYQTNLPEIQLRIQNVMSLAYG